MHRLFALSLCFLLGFVAVSCGPKQSQSNAKVDRPECVQNYQADTDYFPIKTTIQDSQGFQIEYHNSYKVITVKSPWQGAKEQFKYALVQCGTPIPQGFEPNQIIEIPVRRIAIMSTTHLPHLEKLGLLDRLVAISDPDLVYEKETQEKFKKDNIQAIGSNSTVNIEKLLDISPDLITTYGTGNVGRDAHPKLLEAGLKVAINAEYMESTPLGQTEWIKFTALFFNAEEKVNKVYGEIRDRYQKVSTLTKTAKSKPTVVTGFHNNGSWYVPGGRSYVAKLLEDAGAQYLWADRPKAGSTPMSFEAVYDRAVNADIWINGSQAWNTLDEVRKGDDRYADIKALKSGKVFNNNARLNSKNGNDYWQSGIMNPDIVLSDLVKIVHPELLPNHKLVYYKALL